MTTRMRVAVHGMTCDTCNVHVARALTAAGASSAEADWLRGQAVFTAKASTDVDRLAESVRAAGSEPAEVTPLELAPGSRPDVRGAEYDLVIIGSGSAAFSAAIRASEWPQAARIGRLVARLWPGLFWLCVLNAVFLVIGSLVLSTALDVAAPDLFVYSLFLVVVSMPLAILAGIAHDIGRLPDDASWDARMQVSSGAHPTA